MGDPGSKCLSTAYALLSMAHEIADYDSRDVRSASGTIQQAVRVLNDAMEEADVYEPKEK